MCQRLIFIFAQSLGRFAVEKPRFKDVTSVVDEIVEIKTALSTVKVLGKDKKATDDDDRYIEINGYGLLIADDGLRSGRTRSTRTPI